MKYCVSLRNNEVSAMGKMPRKLYILSWVSDTTVIEVHLKTTMVDMAVRVLAEEKGSDLMLWGGAFFLFLYFLLQFLCQHLLFIYSYHSLGKTIFLC